MDCSTATSIYDFAHRRLPYLTKKPAIVFYGKVILYDELFALIDNAANHLYRLGVREGTVVSIHLPNCPQAIISIYALAKLGAICNMIHALTPKAGLQENMSFAKSNYLITWRTDCADVSQTVIYSDVSCHMGTIFRVGYRLKNNVRSPKKAISFVTLEQECNEKGTFPIQDSLSEKCVAYFGSSGTTGEPKTVMHCHRAINNWVANARDFFQKDSMVGESLLSVLPLFHGSGFAMDMHQLISNGGTLVLMAQWDPKLAAKLIKKHKITYLTGVPKVYQTLLAVPSFKGESLVNCFVSGDNVGEKLKLDFNARTGKKMCLFEGYGMTEIVTACFSCGTYHENTSASGFPLRNCKIAVMTENGPASVGVGELLVATNTMMLGYLGSDAPFVEADGVRWLKTGDLGRIDAEGFVYFIERIKNTIIRNGYDIFPAEIEALSRTVDGVEDICVVGITEETGTQRVRAYVVSRQDHSKLEVALKKTWSDYLPRYAIPQEVRFLSELPRNQMAKVDRMKLEQLT